MPLYEYECEVCGKRFERIHKFSDPPIAVCVHCGKSPVRKLFSSPAIQFKGSGFYITDYAKKSSSEAGSKSSTEGEGSKDSKPTETKSTETKSTETKSTETKSESKSSDTPAKKE
jgi:putative FmdB family regulatory protein